MAVQVKEAYARAVLTAAAVSVVTNLSATNTPLAIRIDKCTVSNPKTFATTYYLTVWIVPSGGTADSTNIVIDAYPILSGSVYGCPEIVNHVLGPGTTLQWKADVATKLNGGISITTFAG